MLYVCVRGVMDVVFSVCIVTHVAVGVPCKGRVSVLSCRWLQTRQPTYKRCSCHSGHKFLCKLCRTFPPPAMGVRFTVFGQAGHADPLDGWRCSS